jgi:hypothetical protein
VDPLIRTLIDRLAWKGVEISSIPAFLRNLAYCMTRHPQSNLSELNENVRLSGWDDIELDALTVHLILATFNSDSDTNEVQRLGTTFRLKYPQ